MKELKDIKSYNLKELKEEIQQLGEKPFRAGQIYKWLHVDKVETFNEMTNISKDLRPYEIPSRQFGMYIHPVRMPYGMQILCFNP